ncbi:MAG: non-homologous end joining protein Ku [Candidatus Xenobia bacterium]
MAARALWSGSINFGMVNIPVKLFSATSNHNVSFHLLHAPCKSRVKYQVYCPVHETEVPRSDLVKGYEFAKNQYAVLTEEDFEQLPVPSRQSIELSAFVKLDEVDPLYFEQSFYLAPDEIGKKAYALLVRSLQEKGLVGIAKVTLRNQERVCALRAKDGAVVLSTLHFADEIKAVPEGVPGDLEVSERELQMANTLIDLLTAEKFEAGEFKDEYREALMKLIEAKIQGQEVAASPAPAPAQVVDLMAALRASVEAAEKARQSRQSEPSVKAG